MAANQADIDAFKEQLKKKSAAFSIQDYDKAASFSTEDCRIAATGAPIMVGREGEKIIGQGYTKMGAKEVEHTFDKVIPMGEYNYTDGTFIFYMEGRKVFDKFNFVIIWCKVNGEWLVFSQAFNSQTPPKPPTA